MDAIEFLRRISGRWTGTGTGQGPTIDSFSYREELTFNYHLEYPLLRYEQRTWLLSDLSASHWELGFWRGLDDGRVEISNAQDSGRVETMRGHVEAKGDTAVLHLFSKHLANGVRMVLTERIFSLSGNGLSYTQFMATHTTKSPQRIKHLHAEWTGIHNTE